MCMDNAKSSILPLFHRSKLATSRMEENCNISVTTLAEKRSLVVKIDRYSRAKALLKNCKSVTSIPFSVGGHSWVMRYYSDDGDTSYADCISVYLALDSADSKDVKAKFKFSLLDKDGEPLPPYTRTNPGYTFPGKGSNWGFHDFISKEDLEALYLVDDSLSIKLGVTVMKDNHHPLVVPPSNLHQHLGDLLKSMEGADVTFQVGAERFSAHRSVLAARSSVFKAELFGPMKEKHGIPIEIVDMESEVFKSLLHFIYTDSLPAKRAHTDSSKGDVVMAGHLLVAADRYSIERLKLICEKKLCKLIDTDMVATSLALAEQHSCHGLKEACFEFLAPPSNLEAMMASDGYGHLKSSCPSVLKELIARLLPAEQKAAKDILMEI